MIIRHKILDNDAYEVAKKQTKREMRIIRKVIYKNVKKDAETKKRRPIRRDKKWKR